MAWNTLAACGTGRWASRVEYDEDRTLRMFGDHAVAGIPALGALDPSDPPTWTAAQRATILADFQLRGGPAVVTLTDEQMARWDGTVQLLGLDRPRIPSVPANIRTQYRGRLADLVADGLITQEVADG